MHEMSLAMDIITAITEDARMRKINYISRIDVIIGDLSNVLADALELAFFYLRTQSSPLINEQTNLNIIREKARSRCNKCMREFTPDYRIAICPSCGAENCDLISGETFRVESYEGCEMDEN
ncbi:hydrogenase maturation nickel metallochaperone HypA [Fictibacillus sp. b24]|uniref:hydrogenase maturation nickel metallochaperone HypA/HybF n=1 Tax=Fictibacillus sp. b24 TaxID=3055863 RepID=UPI0025A0062C|nr:hydrogenase maturation nickel metallochaperone HypA [Fictibacillus sp. b24]MDM5315420.1 hydrogenase maturation nickel metallochaperone HypA [Fictibacillus sp. b24]